MKVLYILKQDLGETGQKLVDEHKKSAEVNIIDMRSNKNYDEIIDQVAASDKVITW